MGVVNTVATGLLDLLAAKTGGKMPTQMGEVLQPVISLAKYYDNKKLAVTTTTHVTTAYGAAANFTVPPGELWELVSVGHAWVSVTGAELVGLRWLMSGLPESATVGTGATIFFPPSLTATNIGMAYGSALYLPGEIMLPAGGKLSVVTVERTANVTVYSDIIYRKYLV